MFWIILASFITFLIILSSWDINLNLTTFILNHFKCFWNLKHIVRTSKKTKQIKVCILIRFETAVVSAKHDKIIAIDVAGMSHPCLERLPLPFTIKLRLDPNNRIYLIPLIQVNIKHPDIVQWLAVTVIIILRSFIIIIWLTIILFFIFGLFYCWYFNFAFFFLRWLLLRWLFVIWYNFLRLSTD